MAINAGRTGRGAGYRSPLGQGVLP